MRCIDLCSLGEEDSMNARGTASHHLTDRDFNIDNLLDCPSASTGDLNRRLRKLPKVTKDERNKELKEHGMGSLHRWSISKNA
jgi:hypothetical protein